MLYILKVNYHLPLNFLISFQRNIFLVTCNHTESMKLTAPFILVTVSIGILYLLFCVPTTQAQSSLKLDDGKGAFASTVQQPLKIDDGKLHLPALYNSRSNLMMEKVHLPPADILTFRSQPYFLTTSN